MDQKPRSAKRAAAKRAAVGATAPRIAIHIRVDRVNLDDDDRAYMRRRLGEMLAKHAASIERVSVRIRDVNGPRGGVDLLCRIKVVLSTLPSVVVDHQASSFRPAFLRALAAGEQAVRRALQRKRMRNTRADR